MGRPYRWSISFPTRAGLRKRVARAGDDGQPAGYGRVPQCLVHPTTEAGDIIIFCGFGTGHGSAPFRG